MLKFKVIYAIMAEPNGNYSLGGMHNLEETVDALNANIARQLVESRYGGPERVRISGVIQIL